jgi:hypothetical protein
MNDPLLKQQARALGYTRIPAQLDDETRRYLRLYVNAFRANTQPRRIQWVNPTWERQYTNPWSGEFRFSFTTNHLGQVVTANNFAELSHSLKRTVQTAFNYVVARAQLRDSDYVQLKVLGGNLHNGVWTRGEVGTSTPATRVDAVDIEAFVQSLDNFYENQNTVHDSIDLNQSRLIITYIRRTTGGGMPVKGTMSLETWIKKKNKTIYWIDSKDANDCFWQCLAIALHVEENTALRRSRGQQRQKIGRDYRVFLEQQGCVFDDPPFVSQNELVIIELAFEISIDVYRGFDLRCIRRSRQTYEKKMLLLEVSDPESRVVHYHYIVPEKLAALFGHRKFCTICEKGYDDIRHKCILKCYGCKLDTCEGKDHAFKDFQAYCERCHRNFYNEQCLQNHHHHCEDRILCLECNVIYAHREKSKPHECYISKCKNCRQRVDNRKVHSCYMTGPEEDKKETSLYFYDYECYQDEKNEHHIAMVVVLDSANQRHVYRDNMMFIQYVLQQPNSVFIGHNAARYDSHFVKRALLTMGIQTQDVINGCSIIEMKIPKLNIRFIDSRKFIPMALRHFPKTFGIPDLSKGFFPYRFFTKENEYYKGPIPDREWFEIHKMSARELEAFDVWYSEQEGHDIDLNKICEEYCIIDVELLAAGCRIFQELFKSIGMDPFKKKTIAGVCLELYKKFYLPKNTVAIYDPDLTENPKLRAWKNKLLDKDPETIFTTLKDLGIVKACLPSYGKEAHAFRLCLDSGCLYCKNRHTPHPTRFQPMMHLDAMAQKALENIRGRNAITRECQFVHETSAPKCQGLNIRDALYGGRTEVFWEKCVNERMGYVDFTSLYPFVLAGEDAHGYLGYDFYYPVGHPTLYSGGRLDTMFGFARCRVKAPEGLKIPLLPHRRDGKLMFELGTFEGCWTTIELKKAVEIGYEILDVYAIAHYKKKSKSLFEEYIHAFYQLKIEATGWKKLGLQTEPERQAFRDEMDRRYGITNLTMVEECNEGMYYISKLCLNSLWGKFAQRDTFSQTKDVFTEEECFSLLEDDTLVVNNVFLHNQDARSVTYTKKKGFNKQGETNIAIAAYCTAYGRLCLYSVMEKLGADRLLYCDTDSMIYRITDDMPELPIGTFLGELTNELDTGDWIAEFVALGPKSYAYKTAKGKEVVKIKGFTLGDDLKVKLNLKRMLAMAEDETNEDFEMVPQLVFDISRGHQIVTRAGAEKKFKKTQNKRQRVQRGENIGSTPWVYPQ